MRLNSKESIEHGKKIHAFYGTWSNVRKALNRKKKMDKILISEEEVAALRSIQDKIVQVNKACGWYSKPRSFGEGIALIHSEVSEALEGGRKGLMDDHLPSRPMVEVEFADTIIRVLDEGSRQNCDVAGALAEKFLYNQSREDHKLENREKEGGKKF